MFPFIGDLYPYMPYISSHSPWSERMALTKDQGSKRQLWNSLRWPVYIINSVDKIKLSYYIIFVVIFIGIKHVDYFYLFHLFKVSGYGEAITLLLYSSSQVSNHSPSFENLEPEDFKERSMKEEDTFSNNTIFYRTAQYLRLLFLQNHGNEQFKSNAICKDVKCSENKENSGFSRSTIRNDPERRTDGKKDSCMLRIKNATLSFKQGEFIAIVGKHGAGKTKLLSLLSGKLKCGCKQVKHNFLLKIPGVLSRFEDNSTKIS